MLLAHLEGGALVIVILYHHCNALHTYPMQRHFVLGILSVTETASQDIERFQPSVKSLFSVLDTSQKLLEFTGMEWFCAYDFVGLSSIATVTYTLFTFTQLLHLEVQSITIPLFNILIRFPSSENGNIMD